MSNMDLGQAVVGTEANGVVNYSIAPKQTDGVNAGSETETTWQNTRWTQQWGYFNSVPDLKAAIIMKAVWTVGKGYTADAQTLAILDHVTGCGIDTFDDILFNMEVTKRIGGDAFAEIIRDSETDLIVNIKPLDPATIQIVVDPKGIIKEYRQTAKTGNKKAEITFKPRDILHFSNNRLADQIHGISDIDVLEKTILAVEQGANDNMKVAHDQAQPMIIFKIGTDDPTQIALFKTKMESARDKGNANLYVPFDTNTLDYEVIQVNPAAFLLENLNDNIRKFYRALGMPLVLFGAAGSTESGSKMEYFAHEQIWEKDQKQIERAIWNQLNLRINLYPPMTMQSELQTDTAKDGAAQQLSLQPSDTTAGSGR